MSGSSLYLSSYTSQFWMIVCKNLLFQKLQMKISLEEKNWWIFFVYLYTNTAYNIFYFILYIKYTL